jgi:hypothetical protein
MRAWSGLRPAAPDGLPIAGPTAIAGLYINSGHGTLGWSTCAGTAMLVTYAMNTHFATATGAEPVPVSDQFDRLLAGLTIDRFRLSRFLRFGPLASMELKEK